MHYGARSGWLASGRFGKEIDWTRWQPMRSAGLNSTLQYFGTHSASRILKDTTQRQSSLRQTRYFDFLGQDEQLRRKNDGLLKNNAMWRRQKMNARSPSLGNSHTRTYDSIVACVKRSLSNGRNPSRTCMYVVTPSFTNHRLP